MATLKKRILATAVEEGLIQKELTDNDRLTLHSTIVTGNRAFHAIKESGRNGLNLKQLESKLDLHKTTLRTITKIFLEMGLVYSGVDSDRSIIYYPKI